ncbi:MAG: HU family DNA-binding protein [Deltaproteobacteria bacterium]|nr:HU family DNA-binding protein [Deltaproteobacteria bacterium]
MNRADLIAALQDECRTDRLMVEDFLQALSDLCADTLKNGEPFHVGDIGFVAVNPRLSRKGKGLRAALMFQASRGFRERLNLPEEVVRKRRPGACKTCGLRPGKVRIYDECDPCMHARNRATKKEQRAA